MCQLQTNHVHRGSQIGMSGWTGFWSGRHRPWVVLPHLGYGHYSVQGGAVAGTCVFNIFLFSHTHTHSASPLSASVVGAVFLRTTRGGPRLHPEDHSPQWLVLPLSQKLAHDDGLLSSSFSSFVLSSVHSLLRFSKRLSAARRQRTASTPAFDEHFARGFRDFCNLDRRKRGTGQISSGLAWPILDRSVLYTRTWREQSKDQAVYEYLWTGSTAR
ncbi:hypothetical protein LZ30DRAFT_383144 [Colletotrichum cereale]|nr:hypothetical protein LZ30DRAFT_383144 [Colletotrichum cereale]